MHWYWLSMWLCQIWKHGNGNLLDFVGYTSFFVVTSSRFPVFKSIVLGQSMTFDPWSWYGAINAFGKQIFRENENLILKHATSDYSIIDDLLWQILPFKGRQMGLTLILKIRSTFNFKRAMSLSYDPRLNRGWMRNELKVRCISFPSHSIRLWSPNLKTNLEAVRLERSHTFS